MNYRILNERILPKNLVHILWDVDGTITKADNPDPEICQKIISLADKGIHHSFVTGRDAKWLKKFINFLSYLSGYQEVVDKLHFYPELGLVKLDPVTGITKKEQIFKKEVRKKLAGLFYQTKDLEPYQGKKVYGHFVGGDAEGNLFLIPENPKVEIPYLIWSDSKQVIGTAEVMRNPDRSLNQKMANMVNRASQEIAFKLLKFGLQDLARVSPVTTAINIVPIINEYTWDKDIAAGIACSALKKILGINISDIFQRTVAIGDGLADLKFATPIIGQISTCFVGPKKQFTPTSIQEEMVAVAGTGAFEENGAIGPTVVKEILQLLESKIPSNVIYLKGKSALQKFKEDRGVSQRIKHLLPDLEMEIHDALLTPGLQEAHIHPYGYEMIMIQKGKIDAIVWDKDETIMTYSLKDWGDLIVFRPGTRHTLLVKEKSRVIISKENKIITHRQRVKIALPNLDK
jgi:hypothetical protein